MRLLRTVCVFLAVALFAPAIGSAATRPRDFAFTFLAGGVGSPVTDGRSVVLLPTTERTLRVLGSRGQVTGSFDAPCGEGGVRDVHHGLVLYTCTGDLSDPHIVGLDGAVPPQDLDRIPDGARQFGALGDRWIQGEVLDARCCETVALDWHTGELRPPPYVPGEPPYVFDPIWPLDLDGSDPFRTTPSPRRAFHLARTHWDLEASRKHPERNDLILVGPTGRRKRLDRCVHTCFDVQASDGVVSWAVFGSRGPIAWFYRIKHPELRRHTVRSLKRHDPYNLRLFHTKDALFAGFCLPAANACPLQLYATAFRSG